MAAKDNSTCRMYRNTYPKEGDIVMVRVDKVTDICAHVTLLEYANVTAIILLSNLSRKRIRSVAKHIRIGKNEYLRVLRVDEARGYIDLTKKDVEHDDIIAFQENYKKTKLVHNIITNIASQAGLESLDIYNMGIWDMYDTYPHALECFLNVIEDQSILDRYNFTDDIKKQLRTIIATKFAAKPHKLQANFELTCPSFSGIEGIKEALRSGTKESTDDMIVTCQLLSTPIYIVHLTTYDIDRGKKILNNAIKAIKNEIRRQGGYFNIKNPPRVVS